MKKISFLLALLAASNFAHAYNVSTFERPFNANSPWNVQPVNPVLDKTFTIPSDVYYPSVNQGAYSSGIFRASLSDPEIKIYGPKSSTGTVKNIQNPDLGYSVPYVVVKHFPATVVPATGGDGHADIIDESTGIIHSFYQMKFDKTDNVWRATLYAQSPLNGRGWPDGARWYQGARATGVAVAGGMIRQHEARDGKPVFEHALAMSLSQLGLAYENKGFVFPAGSADTYYATNKGKIPEGALMMLPKDYDSSKVKNADLKKVIETLKTYGAYVVDGNYGTPFFIYVENGSKFNIHEGAATSWNNDTANELHKMRVALKRVVGQDYFLNANGQRLATLSQNQNRISMRGPYYNASKAKGGLDGVFNQETQYLDFDNPTGVQTHQWNYSISMYGSKFINWLTPKVGEQFVVTAKATNDATANIDCVLKTADGKWKTTAPTLLKNNQSYIFTWTSDINYCGVVAKSSPKGGKSSVKLEMYRYEPGSAGGMAGVDPNTLVNPTAQSAPAAATTSTGTTTSTATATTTTTKIVVDQSTGVVSKVVSDPNSKPVASTTSTTSSASSSTSTDVNSQFTSSSKLGVSSPGQ